MLWRERGEVVASVQGDRRRTVTVAFGRSSGLLGTLPARPFFLFFSFSGPFSSFSVLFSPASRPFSARGGPALGASCFTCSAQTWPSVHHLTLTPHSTPVIPPHHHSTK